VYDSLRRMPLHLHTALAVVVAGGTVMIVHAFMR
jgi:hypothetical protein